MPGRASRSTDASMPPVQRPARLSRRSGSGGYAPSGAAATIGTIGCAAASPIVATAVLKRPLTYREAHILIGSCVIPIIGGWLVNEAYNDGWLWAPDEKRARRVRHRHHRRHYRH